VSPWAIFRHFPLIAPIGCFGDLNADPATSKCAPKIRSFSLFDGDWKLQQIRLV